MSCRLIFVFLQRVLLFRENVPVKVFYFNMYTATIFLTIREDTFII